MTYASIHPLIHDASTQLCEYHTPHFERSNTVVEMYTMQMFFNCNAESCSRKYRCIYMVIVFKNHFLCPQKTTGCVCEEENRTALTPPHI